MRLRPQCGSQVTSSIARRASLAEGVDADEKLLHCAKDDRRLRAPAMRIGVPVDLLAEQHVACPQVFDDFAICIEDILASPDRHADFFGEASMVVHGRKDRQAVFDAGNIVVRAVAGRDVHLAGAGVEGDEIGKDDARSSIKERDAVSRYPSARCRGRTAKSCSFASFHLVACSKAGTSSLARTKSSSSPVSSFRNRRSQ